MPCWPTFIPVPAISGIPFSKLSTTTNAHKFTAVANILLSQPQFLLISTTTDRYLGRCLRRGARYHLRRKSKRSRPHGHRVRPFGVEHSDQGHRHRIAHFRVSVAGLLGDKRSQRKAQGGSEMDIRTRTPLSYAPAT